MTKIKDYIDKETTERRFFPSDISVEVRDDKPDSRTITGYAAVFNKDSENFGWFIERIAPGAFSDVLQNDTVALFNHDPNYPLARNGVNMTLSEDEFGLKYRFEAPSTTIGNDMLANVRSGVIKQSSFAFTVAEEKWEEKDGKEPSIRTITKVKRLYDVSPVTYPAYPDTTVAARSHEVVKKQQEEEKKPKGLTYHEARVRLLKYQ
jgi:HK97 family phage prohead protease